MEEVVPKMAHRKGSDAGQSLGDELDLQRVSAGTARRILAKTFDNCVNHTDFIVKVHLSIEMGKIINFGNHENQEQVFPCGKIKDLITQTISS